MEASISCFSSDVYTEPLPALKRGLSSKIIIAASTASTLLPPFSKISKPLSYAILRPFFRSLISSGDIFENQPAPPCMTIAGDSAKSEREVISGRNTSINFFIISNVVYY